MSHLKHCGSLCVHNVIFLPPEVFISLEYKPCNSQDLFSNSPYCLLYSSCDVSLENLVLDQLIIP